MPSLLMGYVILWESIRSGKLLFGVLHTTETTEETGELCQSAGVKDIQLALDIAEWEKWPVLYIRTDSWMVSKALRGVLWQHKHTSWWHRGKPICAAALCQAIAARIENLVVNVCYVDAYVPKGHATDEHRNKKQVDKAARNGIWTLPLTPCFNFWSALNWSGSWTRWSLYIPSNQNILFHSILNTVIQVDLDEGKWGWAVYILVGPRHIRAPRKISNIYMDYRLRGGLDHRHLCTGCPWMWNTFRESFRFEKTLKIMKSTTKPHPWAPCQHIFQMPPGMVTQPFPWTACCNDWQNFWLRNFS